MKIRAAAHVHSDWSYDGNWSLPRMAKVFKRAGYNCILTSEHDRSFNDDRWRSYRKACRENSTEDFLIVPGLEYSDPLNIVHVLVWGDLPFLGMERETERLLQEVAEGRGIAVLAHPSRRQAWQQFKPQWTDYLLGVEQWNRKVDGVAPSPEALLFIKQNNGLLPFVGLDFHRLNQLFPLSMDGQIQGRLGEEEVLARLGEKKFRASLAGVSILGFSEGILGKVAEAFESFRQNLRRIIKPNKTVWNKNQD